MEQSSAEEQLAAVGGRPASRAISTSIVAILRERYGRGPMKARPTRSTTSSSS